MTQATEDPEGESRVGEVVEATTTEIVTQCHTLYVAPPLGAVVRTGGDRPIYGVVAEVSTRSIDPGRRPVAMGAGEESVEAVYNRNPQLNRLLSTEFRSLVVAHRREGRLNRYLAPLPPRIHDFVYSCGPGEVAALGEPLEFLPVLLSSPIGSPDEVTASFLRGASLSHAEPRDYLVTAGKELAVLLTGQLQRLNGILRRLST
jgi:hypothetical protein